MEDFTQVLPQRTRCWASISANQDPEHLRCFQDRIFLCLPSKRWEERSWITAALAHYSLLFASIFDAPKIHKSVVLKNFHLSGAHFQTFCAKNICSIRCLDCPNGKLQWKLHQLLTDTRQLFTSSERGVLGGEISSFSPHFHVACDVPETGEPPRNFSDQRFCRVDAQTHFNIHLWTVALPSFHPHGRWLSINKTGEIILSFFTPLVAKMKRLFPHNHL